MKTIDRYLLAEVVRPLSTALLLALLIFLIERMLRLLDVVLGASGPLKVLFEIMAYLVPHYLAIALPISMLLGVMMAFNKLGRDGEIDALQSAGIGLVQMVRPVMLIAAVVTVLSLLIVGYMKPFGRYAYQQMLYAITNVAFQTLVRVGVFTQIGDMTFLIQGIKSDGTSFDRVFMFEQRPDDGPAVITASNGSMARANASGPPVLRLFDGVRLELGAMVEAAPSARPAKLGVLRFEELRTQLGPKTFSLFRDRGVDEREFTLNELWQRRHQPPEGVRESDMLAELNVRLARILTVPLLPFLAIPLAQGRRRSDRAYGIVIGVVILVVYSQVLDFGKNIAETGAISPLLGIWLPWGILAAMAAVLFGRAALHVPSSRHLWPWVFATGAGKQQPHS